MYETAFHKTDLSKLSFLVTGGCGFIGSNIVEYPFKIFIYSVKTNLVAMLFLVVTLTI